MNGWSSLAAVTESGRTAPEPSDTWPVRAPSRRAASLASEAGVSHAAFPLARTSSAWRFGPFTFVQCANRITVSRCQKKTLSASGSKRIDGPSTTRSLLSPRAAPCLAGNGPFSSGCSVRPAREAAVKIRIVYRSLRSHRLWSGRRPSGSSGLNQRVSRSPRRARSSSRRSVHRWGSGRTPRGPVSVRSSCIEPAS